MLKTFSLTDKGKKRQLNQDFVFTSEQPVGVLPNLFIVADGMGGHKAGDYASRCTVETIVKTAEELQGDAKEIIRKAIEEANHQVFEKSSEDENLNGMGSTVVVATCLDGGKLLVANVGDSRLYAINDEITQVTKDHSLVEEMVRLGTLAREEARNHPDKNIITRAVGVSETVEMDFFEKELIEGDSILMCSDGLTNMLEDDEIRKILSSKRDIVERTEELIKAANNNGGKDNIAVVLIEPFANRD